MRPFVCGGHLTRSWHSVLATFLGPHSVICYLMAAERALVGPRRRALASRLKHAIRFLLTLLCPTVY